MSQSERLEGASSVLSSRDAAVKRATRRWPTTGSRNKLSFGAIVAAWLLIYIPGLFRPALLDDADSTHAEAGREMLASGDYVTLHVNGTRYLDKPPLPYWIVAAS